MALTAIQVKEAKPSDKNLKLSDGERMYFLVKVNGASTGGWTIDSSVSAGAMLLVFILKYH